MKYSNIQVDFVERTMQNLSYIEQHKIENENDFNEVTNLINCMIGLVCYPKEATKKDFQRLNTPLGRRQYKHKYGDIYLCLDSTGKRSRTLPEIIRHMRNSICHGNFIQGKTNSQNEIEELRFQDFNKKGVMNFDMVITIAQLRKFVEEISSRYLQKKHI